MLRDIRPGIKMQPAFDEGISPDPVCKVSLSFVRIVEDEIRIEKSLFTCFM